MTITTFDKTACRIIRQKLEAVLAEAGIDGVTFEVGSMRYGKTDCIIKLTAKTEGAADERLGVVSRMAKLYGIANTELGGWKIIDFHAKKRLYPFIVLNPQGAQYKMSPDQARGQFGDA